LIADRGSVLKEEWSADIAERGCNRRMWLIEPKRMRMEDMMDLTNKQIAERILCPICTKDVLVEERVILTQKTVCMKIVRLQELHYVGMTHQSFCAKKSTHHLLYIPHQFHKDLCFHLQGKGCMGIKHI
jgi:hypothetical protein